MPSSSDAIINMLCCKTYPKTLICQDLWMWLTRKSYPSFLFVPKEIENIKWLGFDFM